MERVIDEIIDTERSYVGQLTILMESYRAPLQDASLASKLSLKPEKISLLFSNLQSIITLNKKLLESLEVSPTAVGVATTFQEFTPYLKLYEVYISNYAQALITLGKAARHKKFADWLEKQREASGSPLPFASLLITPVQRCPRYELLLADLLKKSSFLEQFKLKEALELIKETNKKINESQRAAENIHKVWQVQEAFSFTSMPEPLVSPHRKLVHEGKLTQLHAPSMFSSTRLEIHAFLFSDILLCGYMGQSVTHLGKVFKGKVKQVKDKVRGYDGPTGLNQTGDQDLATRRFLTFKLIGLTDLEVEEDCSAIEEQQPKPKKRWSRKVEPNEVDSKEKDKDKDKDKEKAKKRWSRKVEPNEEGDSKEKEKDKDKEKEKEKRLSKELGEPFAVFATATNTRHKFLAHSPEDRGKWIKALKDTIAEHNASEVSRRSRLSRGTMSSRKLSYFLFHTMLGRGILITLLIFCLVCLGFLLFNLWLFFALTQPAKTSFFPRLF